MKALLTIFSFLIIGFTVQSHAEITDEMIECAQQGRAKIGAEIGPLLQKSLEAHQEAETLKRTSRNETQKIEQLTKFAEATAARASYLGSLIPQAEAGVRVTIKDIEATVNAQCDFNRQN